MASTNDVLSLTVDPAWPWSVPGIGLPALLLVALALAGLTVWTYRGVHRANPRRVLVLIVLRLMALALACLAVLRPSLAFFDDARTPSSLIIVPDDSESMSIQDQHGNKSRWEYLRRLLEEECAPQLQQLRDEHNVTILLFRFAADVRDFDPEGKADGKRTDFGEMLHTLYERYGSERNLRGLLILSDGADNGTRYPALSLATRWRTLPCPIHTFAFGQTTTTSQQRDIALTGIYPTPAPVAVKGQLKVKGLVDAPGFENANVVVHLLINGEEVAVEKKRLPQTIGNEIVLTCDAPATPGEIKVTLKIDALPGEMTQVNNEISTYVTVTKEGISVLYVEGKYRAWEPKFIRYALSQEPSIRLFEAVRLTDEPDPGGNADPYQLDKQHYDVIILGDITARRFSANNPGVLAAVYKQVNDRGSGLMMLGGYESFGNSDWDNTDAGKLLPVRLDATGQLNGAVQMVPTQDGLRHYLLRLAENPTDNAAVWSKLPKLDGLTKLGTVKPGALVLARASTGEPIMVAEPAHGAGRTLAFAGDTTWRWRRSEEGVRAHNRFWRQVVFWLAKRDEAEGNVLVLPDTRRLPAGGKLGFGVKLRGKGGVDVPEKDAHFDVSVIAPDKTETKVPTARERGEERGTFWKTDVPGEYVLVARGWGTDTDGKALENLPPAQARFVVYQDEAEMSRQAADHEFLNKLANAGGGKFHMAEDLKTFLKDLVTQPLPQNKPKSKLWPDWRRTPPSRTAGDQAAALAGSGILACFLLFVVVLCLEWFLRRYWGLV
jgi:uncharacterized membrane protein